MLHKRSEKGQHKKGPRVSNAPSRFSLPLPTRFMAAFPDRWDYTLAAIPSPLTDEQEAAQEAKRAEKAAKRKEVLKERKKEKRAQEAAAKAAEEARKKEEEAAALTSAAAAAVRYGKGKGLKAVALSKAEKEEVSAIRC
jgi:hypothetical protein